MNNQKISVYGGFGFVLGEFCTRYKDEVIRIAKVDNEPQSNIILYGISTTDNYNVFDSTTLDIETNLIKLMEVLDACYKKYGKKFKFIFISSWFVYGKNEFSMVENYPIHEEAPCNPKGFYSITKRAAEQLLISYCETFGIQYKILRLANIIGAKDRKVSSKKNALQYLFDKIVHDEPIELYDNGEFYRDYMDVRDCAVAIRSVMDSELPYQIYNISNGQSFKFRELIEFAIKYAQSKTTVWDKLDKPDFHKVVQSKDVFLLNNKLKETGYAPKYTIWETIQHIIDEYKG